MKLILGSSSKYRKEVLEKAGYVFDVLSPDIDEKSIKTNDPYQRPLILARAKADALLEKVKEPAFVIASDQVVICEGKLYEKPQSEDEARQFLRKFGSGAVPETVAALVVENSKTGERYEGVDIAKVFFKSLPESVVESFIKEGEPLNRAGGFTVEHPILDPYIERIEGTIDSVRGLPLDLLKKLLTQAGY